MGGARPVWQPGPPRVLGNVVGELGGLQGVGGGQSHRVAAVTASDVNSQSKCFSAAIRPDWPAVDGQIAQPAARLAVTPDAGEPLSPQAADLVLRITRKVLDEPADLMAEVHAAVFAAAEGRCAPSRDLGRLPDQKITPWAAIADVLPPNAASFPAAHPVEVGVTRHRGR